MLEESLLNFFEGLSGPYGVSIKIDGKWTDRPWDVAWKIKSTESLGASSLKICFDGSIDLWKDPVMVLIEGEVQEREFDRLSILCNSGYLQLGKRKFAWERPTIVEFISDK